MQTEDVIPPRTDTPVIEQTPPPQTPGNSKKFLTFLLVFVVMVVIGVGGYVLGTRKTQTPAKSPEPTPIASIQPTFTPDPTANWKTYTNQKLGFQFQYPADWIPADPSEAPSGVAIKKCPKGQSCSVISVGLISESQLATMGITYCGAYPQDSTRCQTISGFLVDWGPPTEAKRSAYATASHPKGGVVTISLAPVTSETKSVFLKILSTFKFLEQSPVPTPTPNKVTESKFCQADTDCQLLLCSGCRNKEWIKSAPPDLPCRVYSGYHCQCINQQCQTIQ